MASTEHKNRRRAVALERLNIAVLRLAESFGVPAIEIPKRAKDKDMLEITTFEKMADFLETIGGENAPKLESVPMVIKQANRAPKRKAKVESVVEHGR